jgi:hypothetical protein
VGSRFSRIAAPVLGVLAVLAAVGFVLAAPHLLKSSQSEAAIPAPPAGTGEVASVVAPPLQNSPGNPNGRVPPLGPGDGPHPGATATPPLSLPPATIDPTERPSGGGISATPQPGVGEEPESDEPPGHEAKQAHHTHHGHGQGHEHHGNGKGVGHSGDENGDRHDGDGGKHDNGKHNGSTKSKKDPPPKSHHSLGSGHGHGKKSDRGDGQTAKHGKSHGRAHSHSRSRR